MINLLLLPFIINMINSVIGVSILAMPYCFQECGIVLGSLLMFSVGFITVISSDFMVKGAISENKSTYEFLALHVFGAFGKLIVELSMIGVILGSLIAFYVVMGDLGPEIVRSVTLVNFVNMRSYLLLLVAVVVVMPLSLLRNITSLANISAMSIVFYICFVVHLVFTSLPSLVTMETFPHLNWWKFSGVFKCVPIFAMSQSCQIQVFVILNAISEPSVAKMRQIVKISVISVNIIYFIVGILGYIKFANPSAPLHGDILAIYPSSFVSTILKFGFFLSVAISYPLVIFPCRASIYSLLYLRRMPSPEFNVDSLLIPENRWRVITFLIVFSTLILGILLPNVEFVLSLCGAITGSIICYIIPSALYLGSSPNGSQRKIATCIFLFGLLILLISSASTLHSMDESVKPVVETSLLNEANQKVLHSNNLKHTTVEDNMKVISPIANDSKVKNSANQNQDTRKTAMNNEFRTVFQSHPNPVNTEDNVNLRVDRAAQNLDKKSNLGENNLSDLKNKNNRPVADPNLL